MPAITIGPDEAVDYGPIEVFMADDDGNGKKVTVVIKEHHHYEARKRPRTQPRDSRLPERARE